METMSPVIMSLLPCWCRMSPLLNAVKSNHRHLKHMWMSTQLKPVYQAQLSHKTVWGHQIFKKLWIHEIAFSEKIFFFKYLLTRCLKTFQQYVRNKYEMEGHISKNQNFKNIKQEQPTVTWATNKVNKTKRSLKVRGIF